MRRVVEVRAPSRLHFGMLSFGQPDLRQFGGVGAMIESPGLRLQISQSERRRIIAPATIADRIERSVNRVVAAWHVQAPLNCQIEVLTTPPQHVGLGSGTQLAMALAAGLHTLYERPCGNAPQLAAAVGRGRRSAIGLYGFFQGGLLLEAGKLGVDETSPLIARFDLPADWRFVLLQMPGRIGLHGEQERLAFEQLPAVPREVTDELCREALLHLLPAAASGRFDEFSESLYRFGQRAGQCFATQQAGEFAMPETKRLIEVLRTYGVRGVGQTSWGPTLFAMTESEADARTLVEWLKDDPQGEKVQCSIAAPCNRGATIEMRADNG